MSKRLRSASSLFSAMVVLIPAYVASGAVENPLKGSVTFLVSTAKLTQELTVRAKGMRAISFNMKLSGTCHRTVTGVAKLEGGDYESAEDENGVAYLANEYRHTAKNGCELIIWLKADNHTRATMEEVDCKATCKPVEDLMFRKDAVEKTKPTK